MAITKTDYSIGDNCESVPGDCDGRLFLNIMSSLTPYICDLSPGLRFELKDDIRRVRDGSYFNLWGQ